MRDGRHGVLVSMQLLPLALAFLFPIFRLFTVTLHSHRLLRSNATSHSRRFRAMHFLRSFGLPFVLAFLAFLCFTSVFTVKASVRYTWCVACHKAPRISYSIVAHRRTKICRLLASRLPPIPLRHPFAFWPPVFNSLPSIKGPDLAGSAGNIFPALRLGVRALATSAYMMGEHLISLTNRRG
jgi:hypothetical protein